MLFKVFWLNSATVAVFESKKENSDSIKLKPPFQRTFNWILWEVFQTYFSESSATLDLIKTSSNNCFWSFRQPHYLQIKTWKRNIYDFRQCLIWWQVVAACLVLSSWNELDSRTIHFLKVTMTTAKMLTIKRKAMSKTMATTVLATASHSALFRPRHLDVCSKFVNAIFIIIIISNSEILICTILSIITAMLQTYTEYW